MILRTQLPHIPPNHISPSLTHAYPLIVLRMHDPIPLDDSRILRIQSLYPRERILRRLCRESLDDVCTKSAFYTHILPHGLRISLLYSCVMTPPASSTFCFAWRTTLSGVSFGKLMMTSCRVGATATAKAASSETTREASAKRMVAGTAAACVQTCRGGLYGRGKAQGSSSSKA